MSSSNKAIPTQVNCDDEFIAFLAWIIYENMKPG